MKNAGLNGSQTFVRAATSSLAHPLLRESFPSVVQIYD